MSSALLIGADASSSSASLPRPAPSTATLPSSNKKARRMRRAASRDKQRAAAAGTTSATESTTAAHLHSIRDKERARHGSVKKGMEQGQAAAASSQQSLPADASGSAGGLSSVADWMLAKIQSVQSKFEQRALQSFGGAATTAPASSGPHNGGGGAGSSRPVGRSGFGWSGESTSSDLAATSGNETDWEQTAEAAKRVPQPAQQQAGNESLYSDTDAELRGREGDAASSLVRVSSPPSVSSSLVACPYAEFGCEALVRADGASADSPTPDAHFGAATSHHLSLLHARCSVLSSQKQQLAQALSMQHQHAEHMLAHDQRMQRRLQRKADVIAQLQQRAERNKVARAHAEALRISNVQDLVAAFVGQAPADARKLLRDQRRELDDLKAQMAVKDNLLREIVEQVRKQQQAQQQPQQQAEQPPPQAQAQAQAQEPNKPAPRAQKKKQRAAASVAPILPDEAQPSADHASPAPATAAAGPSVASPSAPPVPAPTGASTTPLAAPSRSPLTGAVKSPLSPAPFRLTAPMFKPQPVPKVSVMQQQHAQREAAAAQLARDQAEAARAHGGGSHAQSTTYYSLPHSSLRALGPLVSSAQAYNLAQAFALGQTPVIAYAQQTGQNNAANHRLGHGAPATGGGAEGQPHAATRTGAYASLGSRAGHHTDDSDSEETAAPFTFNSTDEPGSTRVPPAPAGAAILCPHVWRKRFTPIIQPKTQQQEGRGQ